MRSCFYIDSYVMPNIRQKFAPTKLGIEEPFEFILFWFHDQWVTFSNANAISIS